MSIRSSRGLRAAITASLVWTMLPVPTVSHAAALPVVHHVILGDSYSAGNGAGKYYGPNECYRSPDNWGERLAKLIAARGYTVETTNVACNGAIAWDIDNEEHLQGADGFGRNAVDPNTKSRLRKRPNGDDSCPAPDTSRPNGEETGFAPGHFWRRSFPFHSECRYYLAPQIDSLSRTTNLVTMTIGGNDLGFDEVVRECLAYGLAGTSSDCHSKVDTALARLRDTGSDGLEARLRRVLAAVGSRIDPNGVVEYLGYPSLVGDVSIPTSDYPDAPTAIRAGAIELENLQMKVVAAMNAAPGVHPLFVFVPVREDFFGHEVLAVGSSLAFPNPNRWFVAPLDGAVEANYYHPNPTGHGEEARLANQALLTVPSRAPGADHRALDMVLVIDTTGSMGPYIAGVKQSAIASVNALNSVSPSWRVAVVSYRDFPSRTGDANDYSSKVVLGFSSDATAITNAINSLVLGDGGDIPETMYSGVMTAIGLPWRPGVDKRLLVMTDAGALDPEPFTGFTAASVSAAAIALDPAQVIGLAVGSSSAPSSSLQTLVNLTGGAVTSSGSGDAGAAVVAAITSLSSDPLASLTGPYVARPGEVVTLDGSNSFDPVGTITKYSWDINGDGIFDANTTTPTFAVASTEPVASTITLKVTSSTGRSSTATTTVSITNRPDSSSGSQPEFYRPITPIRVLDTRTGVGVPAVARLAAGATLELSLLGRPEIALPDDVSAVALNVTVDHAAGPGYVTVWPCGAPQPLASNLNYVTDGTVPNLVMSGLGIDGKVCLTSHADVDLIADINGYVPAITAVYPTVPVRLLDSRTGVGTPLHRIAAGETVQLQVTDRADSPVPHGATAAFLNVTVDQAGGAGFVTVWPCGAAQPLASNLNFVAGSTVPNLVIAGIGSAGKVCLYSSQNVDLIADVDGYVDAGAPYAPRTPVRLLDTRIGLGAPAQPLSSGGTLELAIPPSELPDPVGGSTVLNVTVDQAAGPGYVTVWPCGTERPLASNLNFVRGSTVPNLVISGIGTDGRICFYASSQVHLIVDLDGTFLAEEIKTGHLAPS